MKWTCSVCGYTYEGPEPPAKCPQCGVPADKFVEVKEGEIEFVDEHVVGVAQGVDPEIIQGLKDNFNGECSEVGNIPSISALTLNPCSMNSMNRTIGA